MTKPLIKPRFICFILVFNLFVSVSFSQFFLSPDEIYQEAGEFMLADEFVEALPLYLQLLEKGYNTANIHYKIGQCYLFIPGQKTNSIQHLEVASKKASKNYTGNSPEEDLAPLHASFLLGMAYRINNQLEKSVQSFESLKDSVIDDPAELMKIEQQLKLCNNATELIKNDINLKVTRLNDIINTSFSNFNPVVNHDETTIYYMDALKFYDAIMQSEKRKGYWQKPDNLTPKIKSDGDYFVLDVSEDGNTLLLRMNDPYTDGDIYVCNKRNGKWNRIKKLNDHINTRYNETHASFANKDKTLYFTSNRPGGYGGLDIFRSDLGSDGNWGPATNLGPVINTALDEESPFMSDDNQYLYFSSQGHFNMGGYDIFVSEINDDGVLQNPVNIGYPLNTTDNDIFYFPLKDGQQGYHAKFTNNSDGNLDIFKYEILSSANPARFIIKGHITLPPQSNIPYENILITLVDKNKNDTIRTDQAAKDGNYVYKLPTGEFELNFSTDQILLEKKKISLPQYLNIDELIVNSELKYEPEEALTAIAAVDTSKFITAESVHAADTFFIRYILFGFDKYMISKEDISYLKKLVNLIQRYPDIQLQLEGHTDAIGSEIYNKALSLRRARQVAGYILASDIGQDRILISGHGEESPVAVNNNADGTDNPEGRKYNRRVELTLNQTPDNLILIRQVQIPEDLRVKSDATLITEPKIGK